MRAVQVFTRIGVLHTLYNTWLYDNILLIIYNAVELLCWKSQQIANLVWKTAEIPDMRYWHNEFDMSSTFTAHFLLCNFYTTTVADDSFITNTLVLSTGTFIIFCRTEDALTEQAIAFGLIGTIVNRFWLGYFSK